MPDDKVTSNSRRRLKKMVENWKATRDAASTESFLQMASALVSSSYDPDLTSDHPQNVERVIEVAFWAFEDGTKGLALADDVEKEVKAQFRVPFKKELKKGFWPKEADYVLTHAKALGHIAHMNALKEEKVMISMAHVNPAIDAVKGLLRKEEDPTRNGWCAF